MVIQEVYVACFPESTIPVTFHLRASPRLEVSSIQDLILLINAGLLNTENAFLMTNMIIGLDLKHSKMANAQTSLDSQQFVPLGMQSSANKE
jgi:hypothetical protein